MGNPLWTIKSYVYSKHVKEVHISSWYASETFSTKLIVLTSCELFPESFIFIDKLNMESLEERRKSLCLKFARKCLQVEKLKKLFPRNLKIHKMLKRGSDKFKVNRSLTTRYRNSAIPQMQRMLNLHERQKQKIMKKISMPVNHGFCKSLSLR